MQSSSFRNYSVIRSHLCFGNNRRLDSNLVIEGCALLDRKCNNTFIRNAFHSKDKISPRGKFFWHRMEKSLVITNQLCIPNKSKEVHFKINLLFVEKTGNLLCTCFMNVTLFTLFGITLMNTLFILLRQMYLQGKV